MTRLRAVRPSSIALGVAAVVLAGLGALWMQWLVTEVASPPAQQGHHDFFALYAAGSLVRAHQPQALYNAAAVTGVERRLVNAPVGAAGYMPFLNPPSAGAVLSPLAILGEQPARVLWLLVTVPIAVACVLLATAGLRAWLRSLAIVLVLTSYPAFQTYVEGQWSFVLLLGALAALAAARRGRDGVAGVALAALWLKPPLLLLAFVWLALVRRWRTAGAAIATVALVTLMALPWTGWASNAAYVGFLGGVGASHATGAGAVGATAWEGGLQGMEGLLGLSATVAGQQRPLLVDALAIAASLLVLGAYLFAVRERLRAGTLTARDGMGAVCVGLLLDPHLYAQDCVLLVVLLALALRETRQSATRAMLIVATTALMDLAALDTLWTAGMPLFPPHVLTLALAAGALLLPARSRVPIPAPAHRGAGLVESGLR